jgi:DNA (cytosine-5)-methyltransferase 1
MRLLDLFCGAGGASMGYYQAGFTEIVGVDIEPQKRYPFEFVQEDAIEFCKKNGSKFDVIAASPPCQYYLARKGKGHIDLIPQTREVIQFVDRPYIIENVKGSNLINPLMLCGTMFGLDVIRHRLFETYPLVWFPPFVCAHQKKVVKHGRQPSKNNYHGVTGHFSDISKAKIAMGIDWMIGKELSQAIPPAYTEWLGKQILAKL